MLKQDHLSVQYFLTQTADFYIFPKGLLSSALVKKIILKIKIQPK